MKEVKFWTNDLMEGKSKVNCLYRVFRTKRGNTSWDSVESRHALNRAEAKAKREGWQAFMASRTKLSDIAKLVKVLIQV